MKQRFSLSPPQKAFALCSMVSVLSAFSCGTSGGGAHGPGGASATGGASSGGGAGQTNVVRTDVIVHLFEWPWTDIAKECENYLGPAGFGAVQVSPPTEHSVIGAYPWWQRYQVVSYELDSRSGSREEFSDMVARCKASGVDIYVDAVINHMTAQASGIGSSGTNYTKYSYPGLYEESDFHTPCAIIDTDYASNAEGVQQCELLGLADLNTGSDGVREKLSDYLSSLVKLGVAGFRVDAAKHMSPLDLKEIIDRTKTKSGGAPKYYLEVIDRGGEAVSSKDYLAVFADNPDVSINEFKYDRVNDHFLRRAGQNVAGLKTFDGTGWGLMPSERAVVFTNNHDTQRADALYYADGASYALGNVFLMTYPYGRPLLMSSFAFVRSAPGGKDKGPPSDPPGKTKGPYAGGGSEPSCASGFGEHPYGAWVCEHRAPHTQRLIQFRAAVGAEPVVNVTVPGPMMLSYSRGSSGFVVLNGGDAAFEGELATGLPQGSYCSVLEDLISPAGCDATVTVGEDGRALLKVDAGSAVILHKGAML